MTYIDFHTHQVAADQDIVAVVDGRDTWGIHPWRADQDYALPDLSDKLAIGECGLDALRGPSMSVQEEVFVRQIRLSEELEKPLVIHCVKALDRLLYLRKLLNPKQSWMFHGFRGKPQQLQSLVEAGFYVSFGFQHNGESLLLCPTERLMLETDADSEHSIVEIYRKVARERGLELSTLCSSMAENYRTFFRKDLLQT